jgi:hypothetical protein
MFSERVLGKPTIGLYLLGVDMRSRVLLPCDGAHIETLKDSDDCRD